MGLIFYRIYWCLVYGLTAGDVAAWLQFGVLLWSALWARKLFREAVNARNLQSTVALFSEIGSEEVREARRWVHDHLDLDGSANFMPAEGLQKAKRVAVALDRVAFMVRQKLTPEDPFLIWQQDEIEDLWGRLKPIIKNEREQNKRADYCTEFEALATDWIPKTKAKHRRESIPAAERCPACDGKGIVFEAANKKQSLLKG